MDDCEIVMINPSMGASMQPQVRRSYQRSYSSDRDFDPQRPRHTAVNMNNESESVDNYHGLRNEKDRNQVYRIRDQEILARKAIIDFGQTFKSHIKSNRQNKGYLFEDDGFDLLSRLADKRPEVIGGKNHYLFLIIHAEEEM